MKLMLDVNAALEGYTSNGRSHHDHDVNLKAFRTLCGRRGIEVSSEDAVKLMRLFDNFKCAR